MINVNTATKNIYKLDSVHKEYYIVVNPGAASQETYTNTNIVDDSMELQQSIFDGNNLQFVGCISSRFTFKLYNSAGSKHFNRGQRIQLSMKAGNTETITLFTGLIDSSESDANSKFTTVTAYDRLTMISGTNSGSEYIEVNWNMTMWFNNHTPCHLDTLMREVLQWCNFEVDPHAPQLANSSYLCKCGSVHKVTGLAALDLIKDICIINGCFGYVAPDGKFSWVYPETSPYDTTGQLYPSDFAWPSDTLYPGVDSSHSDANSDSLVNTYESLTYRHYQIKPIIKVVVADNEDDKKKGSAGTDGNNVYKVLGNVCCLGEEATAKSSLAAGILSKIRSVYYTPFEAKLQGLPFMQPGDNITFYDPIKEKYYRSFVLSRTLKMGQHLVDTFRAEGDEFQHLFTVGSSKSIPEGTSEDVQEQIDAVNVRVDHTEDDILNLNTGYEEISTDLEDLSGDFQDFNTDYNNYKTNTDNAIRELQQQGLQANIKIVSEIPANPLTNTLYLIKGDTMII